MMGDQSNPGALTTRLLGGAYAGIVVIALAFDLLTDQSFGATMLSVIPIAVVAAMCLLIGPWLSRPRRRVARIQWFIGCLLVCVISLAFSMLGPDQAKTGEVIFTYGAMTLTFPSSLLLPFVMTMLNDASADDAWLRIVVVWSVCVALGLIQWSFIRLMVRSIKETPAEGR